MKEIVTGICANYIKAHQANQLDGFAPLLSKDAVLIRFGRGTVTGQDVILNYLNNMYVYHRTQTVDYSIVDIPFWDMPVVRMNIHNEGQMRASFGENALASLLYPFWRHT